MNRTAKLGGARLSNFELLRLLCMLMVLNLHSFSGYRHGEGLLQVLDFLRESSSICAVDTFILISGYFGIKWRKKGLFNLLFQVMFYSFAVYGVCVITGILQFDKGEFMHCFKAFYDSWGFITWYIILYFVSPLLNAFSDNSTEKQLLKYIVVFYVAQIVIMRSVFGGPINFLLIYLIGRWISKVGTKRHSDKAVAGYFIMTSIIFACAYITYRIMHYDAADMATFLFGYSYASPFVILQAFFLFLIFSRFNIQNNIINWLAASCLSIFLIHMHPAIKQIGYYNYTESLYERPFVDHVLILTVLIIAVFFGSILIDKVRILISDRLYNLLFRKLLECRQER